MNYVKEHKGLVIATILVTLLPIAVGLILWNRLPDQVPIHFGADGQADGWGGKAYAVFFLPILLAAIQGFCLAMMHWDPKRKNIKGKPMGVMIWVCPVISLLTSSITYGTALDMGLDVNFLVLLVLGVILVVVGNYLPKCEQNYTMGIKLPWTLHDEENWNYTHRLAGKIWTVGGLAVILTAFLRSPWLVVAIVLVLVLIPAAASYQYYKAHRTEE